MNSRLAPRGPDSEGLYLDGPVALGHRRLSILDLSPSGAQPMTMGEGGPTIAFNGEVYNFKGLRRELEASGHAFKGHSDTEVMLHAYAEWGLDGLKRLEGIFAFALWDPARKRLVLMRDRLGVKPLFFTRNGDRTVFGSEIKAVLASGTLDLSLDGQALSEYLWYGNSYEDRTIFYSIRSLLPGHWMILEDDAARVEPWWRLEDWLPGKVFAGDIQEAAHRVSETLDRAVERQMVADVPVGIFLSGGLDSSAIAASAMRVQSRPLSSFSVGFDFDKGVNELPKAKMVAKHLGFDHHEVHVSGADLEDVLTALARAHDEPFGDAANIPLYLLARKVRGSVKVVLQGDGGDEMFAGYRRYAILRHAKLWGLWPKRASRLMRGLGRKGDRLARLAAAASATDPAMRMALLLTTETLEEPPSDLFGEKGRTSLLAGTDPFLGYRNCAVRFSGANPVEQMLLTDAVLQLPSQFLAKVDRSTRACGLEARVPLLDEEVLRLALSLDVGKKVSWTRKKIALRESLRGRIPDRILDAPKAGFGVPYEHWLRGPLLGPSRDAILEPRFIDRFGFDRQTLETTIEEHRTGARNRGYTIWKVFQLALWAREHC